MIPELFSWIFNSNQRTGFRAIWRVYFLMRTFKNTVYKNEEVDRKEQEVMLKKYKSEYNQIEFDTKKLE